MCTFYISFQFWHCGTEYSIFHLFIYCTFFKPSFKTKLICFLFKIIQFESLFFCFHSFIIHTTRESWKHFTLAQEKDLGVLLWERNWKWRQHPLLVNTSNLLLVKCAGAAGFGDTHGLPRVLRVFAAVLTVPTAADPGQRVVQRALPTEVPRRAAPGEPPPRPRRETHAVHRYNANVNNNTPL